MLVPALPSIQSLHPLCQQNPYFVLGWQGAQKLLLVNVAGDSHMTHSWEDRDLWAMLLWRLATGAMLQGHVPLSVVLPPLSDVAVTGHLVNTKLLIP